MMFPWTGRAGMFAAVLFSAAVAIADSAADKITINDPFIRAIPPVVKTTAAFMQIQNGDATERSVVGAETPISDTVELHTHINDDGVMRMRRVERIQLPPNETISLQPGGLHVMLFDIKTAVKPGDEIPLTLIFDDGSTKSVTAVARKVQPKMNHEMHNH